MVEVYGMKMIYGEFSEISGEICEDIWLGISSGYFVNEILYSISPSNHL